MLLFITSLQNSDSIQWTFEIQFEKQEKGWQQQQKFMAAMHGNSEMGAGE